MASKSKARQEMLRNAGFDFEIKSADIDERQLEVNMKKNGANFEDIALGLAKEKALYVSGKEKDSFVVGSDQILIFNSEIISKANNTQQAYERLKSFRANSHTLISSVAVARNGSIEWHETGQAKLTMRDFSDDFLNYYIADARDILTSCVGCYALEQKGIQLFEKIDGDYFTILGMPLLPLIGYLQKEGLGL
ncbi:MAG: hypothetical protein GW749_05680 [Alphaproteobacteria bacterium]|nr:hypothetical protein [Alphaproteobacteria bacterium]